jgi:hypothetical protein
MIKRRPWAVRWPLQLMMPGDSFEVDDEKDFNSAKSATSQMKAENPGMVFTQRQSCARCDTAISPGWNQFSRCACRSGLPRKMLTIRRWS